jgi:hypothetical protein
VACILLETLEAMAPQVPEPSVDLNQVREEFHNAVLQEVRLGRTKALAKAMDRVIQSRDEQLKLAGVTLEEIQAINQQAKKSLKKPKR